MNIATRNLHFASGLLLAMLAGHVSAAEVVREYRGSRDQTTTEFEVEAPWILEWRVGSDFPDAARFELWIVDAATGYSQSRIMKIKKTGSGTKLFDEGGRMRLRISASYADWYLKISELTETEANELVVVPKPWER
ncbi:MAG: hypothetical protein AAFX44_00755 [Pseudomonadota bacterium]